MKTEKAFINGRTIHFFDNARGEKGTILGIHGLSGNGHSLDYYRQKFSPDYRFITMDLYGRGESKADDLENDLFKHADDILALMDLLKLKDIILLGYSMGAFISSIVASRTKKVKAVVLLDGFATMSEHQRPIIEPSLGRLSQPYPSVEHYIEETTAAYEKLGIPDSPELKKILSYEMEDLGEHWENKASERIVRQDWETFWEVDITKIGQNISQPVLLIIALGRIGEHPPLFLPEHYEETRQAIENLQVVTSECNHYTMGYERREDINEAIAKFLETL